MMTNFDFLKEEDLFNVFADTAVHAEKVFPIDPAVCILAARQALECAVKWMYAVEETLTVPAGPLFSAFLTTPAFCALTGDALCGDLNRLVRISEAAASDASAVHADDALFCLETLHRLTALLADFYGAHCKAAPFCPELPAKQTETLPDFSVQINFEEMLSCYAPQKAALTAHRISRTKQKE